MFIKKFFSDYDYIDYIRDKIAERGYKIFSYFYNYFNFPQVINYNHLSSLYEQMIFRRTFVRIGINKRTGKKIFYYVQKNDLGLFIDFLKYIRDTYFYLVDLGFNECFWIFFLACFYIIVRTVSNQYHAPDLGKLKTQDYGGNPASVDKFGNRYTKFGIFNRYNIKDIAHEVRFFNSYDYDNTTLKVNWSPYPQFGGHAIQYSWVLLRDGTSHILYNEYSRRRFLLEDTPVFIRDLFLYLYNFIYVGLQTEKISTIITLAFFFILFICKIIYFIFNTFFNILDKIDKFFLSLKKFESIINKLDIYRENKYKYINKYNNFKNKLRTNFYISKILSVYNYIIYYYSYIDKYIVDPCTNILICIYIVTEMYIEYARECWNFWYNIYSSINVVCNYITYYAIYFPIWSAYEYISSKDDEFVLKYGWSPLYYTEVVCLAIISYYYALVLYFVETKLEFTEDFVPFWEEIHDNETLKYYLDDRRSLYMIPIFYILFLFCVIYSILFI